MEAKSSLPYSQNPATCPYSEPDQSSPSFHINFLKINFNINLSLSIYTYIFSVVSLLLVSPLVSPPKPCIHLFCLPYVLYTPPILFFLIWSTEGYMVGSTEHQAPRYVVFSTALLPRPSERSNIFLSTLFLKTLRLRSSLNMTDPHQTRGKIVIGG